MNKGGLISVIVPVYNVEDYLKRCLDSIGRQTYSNIEIILIDDGSTDQSGNICDQYAIQDKRCRVFHQQNSGAAAARNLGLDVCLGDYVMFVDSDDYIAPNACEVLLTELLRHKAELSIGKICWVYPDYCTEDTFSFKSCVLTGKEATIMYFGGGYPSGLIPGSVGKLYSRNLFDLRAGQTIRFPENLRSGEDWDIAYKIFYEAKKITILNEKIYFYVQREGSLSHGADLIKSLPNIIHNIEECYIWGKNEAPELLPVIECGCIFFFNQFVWEYVKKGQLNEAKSDLIRLNNQIVRNTHNIWGNPYATSKIKRRFLLMKMHLLFIDKQFRRWRQNLRR